MPRENDLDSAADEGPSSLPGFLTRSSAPAAAAAEPAAEADAPAPKKRAPRRKAEPASEE